MVPERAGHHSDELLIATAKGPGTGPNNGMVLTNYGRRHREHPYIPTLIYGSLARFTRRITQNLSDFTAEVEAAICSRTSPRR